MKTKDSLPFKEFEVILKRLLKDYPISDEFANADESQPFYKDSCQFVALRYEISELRNFCRLAVKFGADCSKD